jgi:hypothetical protein
MLKSCHSFGNRKASKYQSHRDKAQLQYPNSSSGNVPNIYQEFLPTTFQLLSCGSKSSQVVRANYVRLWEQIKSSCGSKWRQLWEQITWSCVEQITSTCGSKLSQVGANYLKFWGRVTSSCGSKWPQVVEANDLELWEQVAWNLYEMRSTPSLN